MPGSTSANNDPNATTGGPAIRMSELATQQPPSYQQLSVLNSQQPRASGDQEKHLDDLPKYEYLP